MTHPSKRAVALLLVLTIPAFLFITPLAIPHTYCSGCPGPGESGVCQYCQSDHPFGSHGSEAPPEPPPPPTTQEECDEAQEDCESATESAEAAQEAAAVVCTVAILEPTPGGEIACAAAMAYAALKWGQASIICANADDICSRVE